MSGIWPLSKEVLQYDLVKLIRLADYDTTAAFLVSFFFNCLGEHWMIVWRLKDFCVGL